MLACVGRHLCHRCRMYSRRPSLAVPVYTQVGMKSSRTLLTLSSIASVIFLVASFYSHWDALVVFKVASIALLAAMGFRVSKLLGSALTLGAMGDFLLGVSHLGPVGADQLFLFGLGAFLCGHLVYIVLFVKFLPRNWARHNTLREFGVLAVLVTLGVVLMALSNSLGPLLVPVIAYSLVLAGMAITALLADFGNPLVAIGALSFVASDAMLAVSKFRGPFAGHEPLIWITYYLAQLLIFLGTACGHQRPAREA